METTINPTAVAYLRPDQVDEMEGERENLTRKLSNPGIQDKGAVADQLRRLDHQLETQRPKPFAADEIDRAVRREKELREQWTQGMLSAEEMRKAPPGSTDRHIAWEKKNTPAIWEWQNLMRRLHAGSDAREVASIERFRPLTNSMNLDNALIPGKQFFLPPEGAAPGVTFNDIQMQVLRDLGLAEKVALLSNAERAALKAAFPTAAAAAPPTKPEPEIEAPFRGKRKVYARVDKRTTRVMTPEHREKLRVGRERYNAARRAKEAQE